MRYLVYIVILVLIVLALSPILQSWGLALKRFYQDLVKSDKEKKDGE